MREMEAHEWCERYQKKFTEVGQKEARLWWSRIILDIEKKRGKDAADDLRKRMNRIKYEIRSKD
jgi:hypothetical protein